MPVDRALTPDTLAQYHRDKSVSGQGQTWCVLCRPGITPHDGYYPWPCPVWVAAHPEVAYLIRDGYGLNLVPTEGDPPHPVRHVAGGAHE